jgi:hypothetical protein
MLSKKNAARFDTVLQSDLKILALISPSEWETTSRGPHTTHLSTSSLVNWQVEAKTVQAKL